MEMPRPGWPILYSVPALFCRTSRRPPVSARAGAGRRGQRRNRATTRNRNGDDSDGHSNAEHNQQRRVDHLRLLHAGCMAGSQRRGIVATARFVINKLAAKVAAIRPRMCVPPALFALGLARLPNVPKTSSQPSKRLAAYNRQQPLPLTGYASPLEPAYNFALRLATN